VTDKPLRWMRGTLETEKTPKGVIDLCRRRLGEYDRR
jgi:hypothetical protein